MSWACRSRSSCSARSRAAAAGRRSADARFPVRNDRITATQREWTVFILISALVGVAGMLLLPLAIALASMPLLVSVVGGRILGPLVLGYALDRRATASHRAPALRGPRSGAAPERRAFQATGPV